MTGTDASRSSAASLATGNQNRSGVIDEERRGQVVCISRPDKKRPVLILTRDSALEFLGEVTVAPITTTIRDIPSEVLLTKADGMPRDCAVDLDHLQTVSKGENGLTDRDLELE